jgi:serine/threonine protein phosphatase PrpC
MMLGSSLWIAIRFLRFSIRSSVNTSAPRTLLLCSDGLTDCVDEHFFVRNIVTKGYTADDLVTMTLDRGGYHNVSVVIARCMMR